MHEQVCIHLGKQAKGCLKKKQGQNPAAKEENVSFHELRNFENVPAYEDGLGWQLNDMCVKTIDAATLPWLSVSFWG